jgi:hypothetical protein
MAGAVLFSVAPAMAATIGIKPGNLFYSFHEPVPIVPSPEPFEPAEYEKVIEPGPLFRAPASRQAGNHADLSIGMVLRHGEIEEIFEGLDTPEVTKIELPLGVLANLGQFPACPRADFERNTEWISWEGPVPPEQCPPDSQVGVVGALFGGELLDRTYPLYKLEAEPGHIAELAFPYEILFRRVPMITDVDLDADGGLVLSRANTADFNDFLPAPFMTIWGVPGAPIHDAERINTTKWTWGASVPPPHPSLLSNVIDCESGPSRVDLRLTYHDELGSFELPREGEEPLYRAFAPAQTGCDELPFAPEVEVRPTDHTAESPTGLDLDIHLPQERGGRESAPLREATISLPEGMSIDPAASESVGCSAAAIGLEGSNFPEPNPIHFSSARAACPAASRLGSVVIHTPMVEGPLAGSVYLADATEDPFRSRWALYLVADGPGFTIKLPVALATEPGGRLVARLAAVPELPLEDIEVELSEPLLSTPATCGAEEAEARLTPWTVPAGEAPVVVRSGVRFEPAAGGSCEPSARKPFAPAVSATLGDPAPGAASGLSVRIARPAGNQALSAFHLSLPPGFVASLRGLTVCGEGEEVCPPASAVGSATLTAGGGAAPFTRTGRLYLAGPYEGEPYGLVADFGALVARIAIGIDPRTAGLTLDAGSLPSSLDGQPLRIASLGLSFAGSGFLRNPSGCQQRSLEAEVEGREGSSADLVAGLPAPACQSLPFDPGLSLRAIGPANPNPALRIAIKTPPPSAGIAAATISLPTTLGLDRGRLATACRPPGRSRSTCAEESVVGRAVAWSSTLDEPLEGPIRLVAAGPGLPALAIELGGEVQLELLAALRLHRGTVQLDLAGTPDFSFERLELSMGTKAAPSFLTERPDACPGAPVAHARFTAYNGNLARRRSTLQVGCRKEE